MDEATYASIPEKLVLREIRFQVVEPGRRTRKLTIITTLTNPETYTAEDITKLYGYRWHAEIFFRFLKHVLGCRHLYSHDTAGIQIQAYRAIIACMLISLWTGRKPTQRTYEMICYYFLGLAEEYELPAHLAKLQRHEESQKT